MKRILTVGGGPAGVIFSYLYKKSHPTDEVIIYEASDKLLRRVLVSGNGRANFFNEAFLKGTFQKAFLDDSFVNEAVSSKEAEGFINLLKNDFKFEYFTDEEGRMYPFANLSSSLKDVLESGLKKVGVKVFLNSEAKAVDPVKKTLNVNGAEQNFDYLFISVGGKAYDREKYFKNDIIDSLKLQRKNSEAALCPLITIKSIGRNLINSRLKGILTLYKGPDAIYTEPGEILFKKDGISGICVFDASLFISSESLSSYRIVFNPLTHDGKTITLVEKTPVEELAGVFPYPLLASLKEDGIDKVTHEQLLSFLTFKFKAKYSLKESQISLGGVITDQLNPDFFLKAYPFIALGGEEIDAHAICGGFNMGLAFLSGYKAALSLK